jgi:hypothetical protein
LQDAMPFKRAEISRGKRIVKGRSNKGESWNFLEHPKEATPEQVVGRPDPQTKFGKGFSRRGIDQIRPYESRLQREREAALRAERASVRRCVQKTAHDYLNGDIVFHRDDVDRSTPWTSSKRVVPQDEAKRTKLSQERAKVSTARFHLPLTETEISRNTLRREELDRLHPKMSSVLGFGRGDIPSSGAKDAFMWDIPLQAPLASETGSPRSDGGEDTHKYSKFY